AAMPVSLARWAADNQRAAPFDGAVPAARIITDVSDLRPEIVTAARYRGRQFFLPRSVVLDVIVYRRSRVRDAMIHWRALEHDIDAALRASNGAGLPPGYSLEQNPAQWDAYDEAVLAYYWAHRSYDGLPPRARVAHRTGNGVDGQLDFAAGLFRAGGSDEALATRDSVPAIDWLRWETLYRAEGLYASEMYAPGGLDNEGVLAAITRGDVYFAAVDQMEAFTLHGGGHRDAPPRVPDEDDLGFVATPRFRSLDLDDHGRPARNAKGFSFVEEDVWTLPVHGRDRAVAYDLVQWVLSRDQHARECAALGMLPMRTDVHRDRVTLFRAPWMLDVFEAGFAEWNRAQPPPATLDSGAGLDLALTWDQLVRGRAAGRGATAAILAVLRAPVTRMDAPEDAESPADAQDPDVTMEPASFVVPPLRERAVFGVLDAGVTAMPDAAAGAGVER
ncbi:MAG: hypothetical protein WCJ30_08545, partial [Deltaproteobacteria bacterium]